jgi:DNA-directed RNA polymerase subunit RPC12/RpoP
MDIEFDCSKCGQNIVIDAAGAGLTVQCPKCNRSVVVPSPKLIKFNCSKCGQRLSVDETSAGVEVRCSVCGEHMIAPSQGVVVSLSKPPKLCECLAQQPETENLTGNAVVRIETQTNVNQGAVIWGWVCFFLGILCVLILTAFSAFIYGPLFLASFILGIIAIVQGRMVQGIFILIANIIGAPVLICLISAFQIGGALFLLSK